jgi:integrase
MRGKSLDTARIKVGKPRGRHPDRRLNAVSVRNTKTPGRYADGNGLYLFVDESGAKRWLLRTVVGGKRRDIGLGSTQLVPLADAREEAAKLRRMARAGGDPLSERRRERRTVPTFEEAALKVHAAHAATFKNAKHAAQWLASLKSDVFPMFGGKTVDTVEPADVLRALSPIWISKPETARRLKQRIKVVLDWAKASGHRTGENAVEGVARALPKHRTQQTHHAALPYAQVPQFLRELCGSPAGDATKLALEFLILTAARTGEVLGARWEEIDLDAGTWTVPAARMKAGREHRVPLAPRCLELLEKARAIADGGGYVFPGRTPKAPLSNMALLMLIRRMGHEDITAHGFRSSFRDWAAERSNASSAVVEASLAHAVKDKTEAAYFRSDLLDQRRSLLEAWSQFANQDVAAVIAFRA